MDDRYHESKYMEPGIRGMPWPYFTWSGWLIYWGAWSWTSLSIIPGICYSEGQVAAQVAKCYVRHKRQMRKRYQASKIRQSKRGVHWRPLWTFF